MRPHIATLSRAACCRHSLALAPLLLSHAAPQDPEVQAAVRELQALKQAAARTQATHDAFDPATTPVAFPLLHGLLP